MQGGLRVVALALILLLTAGYLPSHDMNISENLTSNLAQTPQILQADSDYNQSWNVKSGEYYSIQTNCLTCSTSLSFNGTELAANQQNYSGRIVDDGLLKLSINNPNHEEFTPSYLLTTNDSFANNRPSPGSAFGLHDPHICSAANQCVDSNSPLLASQRDGITEDVGRIISGVTTDEQSDYIGLLVTPGATIEFSHEHSSANIAVEAYFQNSTTESDLGELFASVTTNNFANQPNVQFINFEQAGRLILKIGSANTDTVWSIGIILHQFEEPKTVDLTQVSNLCGHNTATLIFANDDTTALIFTAENFAVDYSYQSLIDGVWVSTGSGIFVPGLEQHLFPLPTSNAVRITVNAPVFCLQTTSTNFSDGNSGNEAPSLPPILSTTDNSSWPVLDIFDVTTNGEFTHSIRDTSDVFRIEIDAWEDSVHFIMLEVTGDINQFEIELIEKDQDDWSEKQTKVRTLALGKLSVAMEVSRGTHFFRISIINNSVNNSWGDYTTPTKYTIVSTYELVDEGEEPWFPPDENAEKWGEFARWFMGALFLAPAVYLGISQSRKKSYARQLLTKQQRLDWLKSRLDSGISPRKNRRDLARSLGAVATLDWDDACSAWGKPDLSYRTENVAIAGWRLDPRITKESEAWPVIIGVYIIDGNWEIAALKFDSPEGKAWEIKSITPRFLFSGSEVFLDTMNHGNKTFISVELTGEASSVDIELNGRLNGKPHACRAVKSLFREEEE